jgi:DNA-binding NarL/FixJ family response regulator
MEIRILLIDEHRPSREMLARRLASFPDIEVVGSTDEGDEGVRQIKELHPDLVLLDIKMKKVDGVEVCRRAATADGVMKVAILTSYIDPEERRMAYQAGASGYFLKEADTPKLARWIRLVARMDKEAPPREPGPEL